MKNLMIAASFFCLQLAQAEILKDQIHSVVAGENGKPHMIRFENGRVAFVDSTAHELETLKAQVGGNIEATLDQKSKLVVMKSLDQGVSDEGVVKLLTPSERPPFDASVVSPAQLQEIWNRMNPNYTRKSECSDRAHVWAYDEFVNHGLKSSKAFIFFTRRYIEENNFKWWFHVAPMVNTAGTQMVLDHMYMDRPVTVREWKDMMVFSKRECRIPEKISQYHVNDQSEDCFMMFDSMYHKLPGDFDVQESSGVYRTSFNEGDIRATKARAFNPGKIQ